MSSNQNEYIIECPHCKELILINTNEINCGIFRHAVYKHNLNQNINPHASKDECERLLSQNAIYGCAKPFKIQRTDNQQISISICEYI